MSNDSIPAGHVRDYYPETSDLLRMLMAAGIAVLWGENGGDETFKFDRTMPFARELTACDDSSFVVLCPDGKRRGVRLVLGNCPGELVNDYHTGCPVLESVIEKHADKWEKRRQPSRFCPEKFNLEAHNARASAYGRHYHACQAGGMNATESNEVATEHAAKAEAAFRAAVKGGAK